MSRTPVIAVFDIGKTNKKLLLFDEQYRMVLEKSQQLEETTDEDGDACEDLAALTRWVQGSLQEAMTDESLDVRAPPGHRSNMLPESYESTGLAAGDRRSTRLRCCRRGSAGGAVTRSPDLAPR